jgi:hypothetical protein
VRTSEYGDGVQCPNDRNPILFTQRTSMEAYPVGGLWKRCGRAVNFLWENCARKK